MNKIKIAGMTGTRNGLSKAQRSLCIDLIEEGEFTEWHHGDCIGADAETHDIAFDFNLKIIIHPPIKDDVRAHKNGTAIRRATNYFARNRNIVNESEILFGFPPTEEPQSKGGTWYTINYGISQGKPVVYITPSGKVVTHNLSEPF